MLFALLAVALADVRFERVPQEAEKTDLGPAPFSEDKGEHREWRLKAYRRGALAALDVAIRHQAGAVDACVRGAGGAEEVAATVRVVAASDLKVLPKGGDAALGRCVAESVGTKHLLPIGNELDATYTVTWSPAAPAVHPSAAPVAPAAETPEVATPSPAEAAPAVVASAADPSPTAPAANPPASSRSVAFAPGVDTLHGFGALSWGDKSDAFEGMYAQSTQKGTSFYTKQSDYFTKWLGASLQGVRYAIGEGGLHSVSIGITGSTATYRVREELTARYGQPRWDNRFSCYYWRGETRILVFQTRAGADDVAITIMDIARARASGLADRLPGDPVDSSTPADGRRLPGIFKDG